MEKPSGFNKLKFRSFLSFFTLIFLIFGIGFGGWFVINEIQQVNIVEEDIFPIIIDNDINKQDKLAQDLGDKTTNNSGHFFFKSNIFLQIISGSLILITQTRILILSLIIIIIRVNDFNIKSITKIFKKNSFDNI